jgi:hypothetical protein
MQAFRTPAHVAKRHVDPQTTYEGVAAWWCTPDAAAAREAVRMGAVCFVHLGGSDQVFVCMGARTRLCPCTPRGRPGIATLMTYT